MASSSSLTAPQPHWLSSLPEQTYKFSDLYSSFWNSLPLSLYLANPSFFKSVLNMTSSRSPSWAPRPKWDLLSVPVASHSSPLEHLLQLKLNNYKCNNWLDNVSPIWPLPKGRDHLSFSLLPPQHMTVPLMFKNICWTKEKEYVNEWINNNSFGG